MDQGNETRRLVIGAKGDFEPEGFGDLRIVPGARADRAVEMDLYRRALRSLIKPLEELARLVVEQDEEHELWDLSVAIWTGVLVQYARCFDPTSRTSLRPSDVFVMPSLLAMHEDAMLIRSKHLAHDVNSMRQAYLGVKLMPNNSFGNFVMPHAQFLPNNDVVQNTRLLVSATLDFVEIQRGRLMQELSSSLREMSIEDRLALPKVVINLEGTEPANLMRSRRRPKQAIR